MRVLNIGSLNLDYVYSVDHIRKNFLYLAFRLFFFRILYNLAISIKSFV